MRSPFMQFVICTPAGLPGYLFERRAGGKWV